MIPEAAQNVMAQDSAAIAAIQLLNGTWINANSMPEVLGIEYLVLVEQVKHIERADNGLVELPYVDSEGKSRTWRPDVSVIHADGRQEIVEFKCRESLDELERIEQDWFECGRRSNVSTIRAKCNAHPNVRILNGKSKTVLTALKSIPASERLPMWNADGMTRVQQEINRRIAKDLSARKFFASDPEKWRKYQCDYRAKNPEKWREYYRSRYAANPELYRERSRKRLADPERRAKHNAARRAKRAAMKSAMSATQE